jgi:hypothetical protein
MNILPFGDGKPHRTPQRIFQHYPPFLDNFTASLKDFRPNFSLLCNIFFSLAFAASLSALTPKPTST